MKLACLILGLLSSGGHAFTPQYAAPTMRVKRSTASSLLVSQKQHQVACLKSVSLCQSATDATEEGLTEEKIGVLLEVTFIEACLQIATGYVDVLKLFLATLKAAYDKKIPIPDLMDIVSEMDKTRKSANRELTPEEISLRTLWMNISYLTLEYLERIEGQTTDLEFDSNIEEALQESLAVSITTRGTYKYIVEEKVLEFLGEDVDSFDPNDYLPTDDTAQAAMMMYSFKIIDLILVVVNEERVANDSGGLDGNGVGPPRPNIPGAY